MDKKTLERNRKQQQKLHDQYLKFIKLINYDYEQSMVTNNVGNEARTFHIMNKSKPLLSPSRLLKPFTEHKFFMIPKKNLLKPRIMGQIIHHLLELSINMGEIIKIDLEELSNKFPSDYEIMSENWSKETIDSMISDINKAVVEIINFLASNNMKVLRVEKHVNNFEYHGFIDLVCVKEYDTSNSKQPIILDLKVSSMKVMQPSWITQLSIYWEILERTCSCAILLFDRDTQKCSLLKVNAPTLKKNIEQWNNLVKMHRG